MTDTKPRALILSRVSTSSQLEGVSLDEQVDTCRRYCEAHDLTPVELPPHVPRDISGALPFDRRVDLHAALAIYQRGDVDKILVYAQHRLERDATVLRTFVGEVRKVHRRQGDVISAITGQPIKGNFRDRIESEFNAEWRLAILDTTYPKRYHAIAAGQFQMGGTPPFGYRRQYGFDERHGKRTVDAIVVDAEAAGIVRRVFTMYRDGLGIQAISRRLNDERVPTPSTLLERKARKKPFSGLWHTATVRDILRDQAYVGRWYHYTKPPTDLIVEREIDKRIDRQAVCVEVPRIIDDDLWQVVQVAAALKRARSLRPGAAPTWALQTLVHCECGELYQKRPTRAGTRYLQCLAHRRGKPCSNRPYYRVRHDDLGVNHRPRAPRPVLGPEDRRPPIPRRCGAAYRDPQGGARAGSGQRPTDRRRPGTTSSDGEGRPPNRGRVRHRYGRARNTGRGSRSQDWRQRDRARSAPATRSAS